AGRQQDRADGDGLADAGGRDGGLDEPHGVVHREHRGQLATLAVDVEVDLLFRVLRLEVQQLRDQRVGHPRIDRRAQIDDAFGQQMRVDVHDPLAARLAGDHIGNGVARHEIPIFWRCGTTWPNESTMWSMKPYSLAWAAVNQRSCSESS